MTCILGKPAAGIYRYRVRNAKSAKTQRRRDAKFLFKDHNNGRISTAPEEPLATVVLIKTGIQAAAGSFRIPARSYPRGFGRNEQGNRP
jgi:hypothetical protein